MLAEFRLDLVSKQLSWGFSYRAAAENTFFFYEETFIRDGGQWRAYIDITRFAGIRSILSVRNLGTRIFIKKGNSSARREQMLCGNRGSGP
jgi:hypothetical protein